MTSSSSSRQFAMFLIVVGLAAAINVGSRAALGQWPHCAPAIVVACRLGVVSAFIFNKLFVFNEANTRPHQQMAWFAATNTVALSRLAVPTSGEIFGTITTAQWFPKFPMDTYCLALAEQNATTRISWLRAAAILFIALTDPFSILLLAVVMGMLAVRCIAKRYAVDPSDGALSGLALSATDRRNRAYTTVMTTALIRMFAVTNQQYMRRTAFIDYAWRTHTRQPRLPGPQAVPANAPGWGATLEIKTTKDGR